jgi:hypothetical protein
VIGETCLKCGVEFVGQPAEAVRRGNGFCRTCAGREAVEVHAVICASRKIHANPDLEAAIFMSRREAEAVRAVLEEQPEDCGPHRVVTLRSNRIRALASHADHKKEESRP